MLTRGLECVTNYKFTHGKGDDRRTRQRQQQDLKEKFPIPDSNQWKLVKSEDAIIDAFFHFHFIPTIKKKLVLDLNENPLGRTDAFKRISHIFPN